MGLSREQSDLILWIVDKIPAFAVQDVCEHFNINFRFYQRAVTRIEKMEWSERQKLIGGHCRPRLVFVGGTKELEWIEERIK